MRNSLFFMARPSATIKFYKVTETGCTFCIFYT